MTMHKLSIRLRGCNTFTEKFPGGSVNDALRLAAQRYPEAQNIHWLGETQTDEQEAHAASFFADVKRRTDETNARVFGQQNNNTVHNDGGYDTNTNNNTGDAASLGLLAGCGVAVAAVGVAVLTFPVIVGGATAKVALGASEGVRRGFAPWLLTAALAFAGGTAGGFYAQRAVMPDVSEGQVEIVQQAGQWVQDTVAGR